MSVYIWHDVFIRGDQREIEDFLTELNKNDHFKYIREQNKRFDGFYVRHGDEKISFHFGLNYRYFIAPFLDIAESTSLVIELTISTEYDLIERYIFFRGEKIFCFLKEFQDVVQLSWDSDEHRPIMFSVIFDNNGEKDDVEL